METIKYQDLLYKSMKYIGATKKSKLTPEELNELGEVIEISDDASAIMEEIQRGFEALRISNLRSK